MGAGASRSYCIAATATPPPQTESATEIDVLLPLQRRWMGRSELEHRFRHFSGDFLEAVLDAHRMRHPQTRYHSVALHSMHPPKITERFSLQCLRLARAAANRYAESESTRIEVANARAKHIQNRALENTDVRVFFEPDSQLCAKFKMLLSYGLVQCTQKVITKANPWVHTSSFTLNELVERVCRVISTQLDKQDPPCICVWMQVDLANTSSPCTLVLEPIAEQTHARETPPPPPGPSLWDMLDAYRDELYIPFGLTEDTPVRESVYSSSSSVDDDIDAMDAHDAWTKQYGSSSSD